MAVPDARFELEIDGAWVDVTADVRAAGTDVVHQRGRREGASRTDPAAATFTLASPGGRYSNRNPRSPYFGLLGRNTPARMTVAGPAYLSLSGVATSNASTPDTAVLDIAGDLDVRFDVDLAGIPVPEGTLLGGKYEPTGDQRSWFSMIGGSRELIFRRSSDGLNWTQFGSTEPIPETMSGRIAVRSTFDATTGEVTHYTATSVDGPWTQLGATGTGPTTATYASSAPLVVGSLDSVTAYARAQGRVHAFQLRNGIDGALVADVDFADVTAGSTAFADGAGLTWTVGSEAEIADRYTRFHLGVSEWPPSWHVSGHNVTADLTASGTLRRLGQGQSALDSTLRRRIPGYGPLAYWPMEDQGDATHAASPIDGVSPMAITNVDWEANSGLVSSRPLPQVDTSAGRCALRGTVPTPSTTLTEWSAKWIYRLDGPNTGMLSFMRVLSSGTVVDWHLNWSATEIKILGYDATGAAVVNSLAASYAELYDHWVLVEFWVKQNGANVDWKIRWLDISQTARSLTGSVAGTVGNPTAFVSPVGGFGTELNGMAVGHASVWPVAENYAYYGTAWDGALQAWTGEPAGERVARLADEESLSITVHGTEDLQQAMGPQLPAPLLTLLEECEATDGGILYEDRDSTGLRFRDRASLYNQTPKLIIPYGKLAPPLTPVDDDQQLRNDVTRQRIGGSSARVVVEDGPLSVTAVGLYDESVSLSMHDDTQPLQIAGWAAHLGTWDEARYPSVRLFLHKYPALVADVLALDVGDMIRITDLPDFLPPGPVDLLVMGYREDIGPRTWDLTLFCEPAGPWRVAELDSDDYARLDTDGSELAGAVDADDTALSVTTTSGPVWVDSATYPSDLPFDIRVGGEVMTVTAVTGTSSPQAFTVARSVNGITKSHAAGTSVELADPVRIPL